MDINDWNEVVNGENTYNKITDTLLKEGKCIFGWSDDKYDHRDFVFVYKPKKIGGDLQRGMKEDYLYVGMIDYRLMGFPITKTLTVEYIKDKLVLGNNECSDSISYLIKGVMNSLYIKLLEEKTDDKL